jgi:hypothetical protein
MSKVKHLFMLQIKNKCKKKVKLLNLNFPYKNQTTEILRFVKNK